MPNCSEWEEPCVMHKCYQCRITQRCMLTFDPYELHMLPDTVTNKMYWCRKCYHERDCLTLDALTGKSK